MLNVINLQTLENLIRNAEIDINLLEKINHVHNMFSTVKNV